MKELRRLAQENSGICSVPIDASLVHGNPHIEILAQASLIKANLIILGTDSRTAFENLNRDRIAFRILAHARCPVLTLIDPASGIEESQTIGVAMQDL
jgi:nucleotide-binding universal stress UspA family protein